MKSRIHCILKNTPSLSRSGTSCVCSLVRGLILLRTQSGVSLLLAQARRGLNTITRESRVANVKQSRTWKNNKVIGFIIAYFITQMC